MHRLLYEERPAAAGRAPAGRTACLGIGRLAAGVRRAAADPARIRARRRTFAS
ncbi:hypothetical protein [Streptomyces sp. NPDC048385]|uniref:hypothetical protein n=1 Tax=unclassified Streptomyces TaxID=2593676 RepID=UPI0034217071